MPDDPKPESTDTELEDDALESVAGGLTVSVIDGGCTPDGPWKPTPTFPDPDFG